jgi:uncharacterized protein YhaN
MEELEAAGFADDVVEAPTSPAIKADALIRELEQVRNQKAQSAALLEGLKAEKSKLGQRRTEIATELRVRRSRRDELAARYVRSNEEPDRRAELVSQTMETTQGLNSATRDRAAWLETAIDDEGMETMSLALKQLRADTDLREERLGAVREEIRHIEGMLTRDFEDGAGDQERELEARLVDINERLELMKRRIAALRLLCSELAGEIARHRDQISLPLARRLSELAVRVWPGADFSVTPELGVGGLVRNGLAEVIEGVSAGTREQIAVLARLAYGGMLAEGGHAMPVILDDPLVFSDDNRLAALFAVMADAAEKHQIIVLTCHERAFEPLIDQFAAKPLRLSGTVI